MTKPHKRIKKFTPEFSEFIGRKQATRILAYKIVIAYVKEHNLQDPDDKTYFVPNKKMSKIFGTERIHLGGIQKVITAHVLPPAKKLWIKSSKFIGVPSSLQLITMRYYIFIILVILSKRRNFFLKICWIMKRKKLWIKPNINTYELLCKTSFFTIMFHTKFILFRRLVEIIFFPSS